ncbi:hypothetical protein Tco_1437306 [Tanacetum coccineum]
MARLEFLVNDPGKYLEFSSTFKSPIDFASGQNPNLPSPLDHSAKDDLRKAYEKCNDISQESRALIDTFLKEGFGVESSSGMESDNSSGDETLTRSLYENSQIEKSIKAVIHPQDTLFHLGKCNARPRSTTSRTFTKYEDVYYPWMDSRRTKYQAYHIIEVFLHKGNPEEDLKDYAIIDSGCSGTTFKGRIACKVWTLKEDLMLFLRGGIQSEMIDFLRYDELWRNQTDWEIIRWRLNESSGVHTLELEDGTMIYMLAKRRYPLSRELMIRMLDHGMEVEDESEIAISLIHLFIL